MSRDRCKARYNGLEQCDLVAGHLGVHERHVRVSWADDGEQRVVALKRALAEALQHIDDPDVIRGLAAVLDG